MRLNMFDEKTKELFGKFAQLNFTRQERQGCLQKFG